MKTVKPIKLYKTDGRPKTAYLLSSGLAILLVVVGWFLTVASDVRNRLVEAKQDVSQTATQAREQLRQTKQQAEPITQKVTEIKEKLKENAKEAETVNASERYILDSIKQQIEADQSKSYVEEERTSS